MGCKRLDYHKQKQKQKKGLWSPDEDLKLRNYIVKHGHGCWSSVAINAGLQRNGKSCRLRWINYLRPGLKRGAFSLDEEDIILSLHQLLGNKWSKIAHHLPGRTDNEIKNHWHSYLKKRVSRMAETEVVGKSKCVMDEHIQDQSPSSIKSTPQDSNLYADMEASTLDTDQSTQQIQMGQCKGDQKGNLPKVLFAEWLSLDQFHGGNDNFNYNNYINLEDSLASGIQLNEEMHPKSDSTSTISVDDMLQLPFCSFDDHISATGLVDYFPGEFNICCDDGMYI